jgi:uncharacterized protein
LPNHLAGESSPYLQQHAANPVDWYPWGEEAFKRARTEDKPVLLSVGYSACHWCHVMAHESFQNAATAKIMNQHFINIKVDREERPDLDHIFMEAVQSMTGGGGWPMTVFLTPQGKPFFGGTYFPPDDRQGLPAFSRVLLAAAEAYKTRRSKVEQTVDELTRSLTARIKANPHPGNLNVEIFTQALSIIEAGLDRVNGGFGSAPKFPHPMTLEFLLRCYLSRRDPQTLSAIRLTLDKMSRGGIYDQIGGGFHRYSTDEAWRVPHFEKMLYDNALLSRVFLQAFAVTGESAYARITQETLDYLLREMKDPQGGFYSTQDADSEGEEGKYYLWTYQEIEQALGEQLFGSIGSRLGVSQEGNFEGKNILYLENLADEEPFEEVKKILLKKREQRNKPGRDEKILAAWNGLVLMSLTEAAGIMNRMDYRKAAESNAEFILESMIIRGKLMHCFKDGKASIPGFLEDYALTAFGFLTLHGLTGETRWLLAAENLTQTMVEKFEDNQTGLLFDTEAGQSDLYIRPKNIFDGATPAGSSAAVMLLLKMAVIMDDRRYRELAERELASVIQEMEHSPLSTSQWLCALDFYLASPLEIVTTGNAKDIRTQSLLGAVNAAWFPQSIIASYDPSEPGSIGERPLFKGRGMINGQPAVYLCRNNSCQPPITDIQDLKVELQIIR